MADRVMSSVKLAEEESRIARRLSESYECAESSKAHAELLSEVRGARSRVTRSAQFDRILRQLEAHSLANVGQVEESFRGLLEWYWSEREEWRLYVALEVCRLLSGISSLPVGVLVGVRQMFLDESLDPRGRAALLHEIIRRTNEEKSAVTDEWFASVQRFAAVLGVDWRRGSSLAALVDLFFRDQRVVEDALVAGKVVDPSKLKVPWWRTQVESV